jgi:peptidoglycan/LPS O-acetylase OafA/YrhL
MYRREIDGLRAISVISVILYHFNIDMFSGGFVGVDMFFVISGFLITQLIHSHIQSNSFAFPAFYIRRAKRLFPALLFTIIISYLIAFYNFTPEDFSRFSGAAVTALIGLSNFYYLGESGYFDSSIQIKPLLHTWSLGVEEQFYLFWPLLLVFLHKNIPHKSHVFVILTIVCISIISTEYLMQFYMNAMFFLMPFRVFEFGLGAILVWVIRYQPSKKMYSGIIGVVGLSLIVYSITTFTKDTIFPGYNALLPCIGAVLIIYSGTKNYLTIILANVFSVHIGKISYSLYLAHWPVIVFYSYQRSNINSTFVFSEVALLLLVTYVIAIFMFTFIETPFREKQKVEEVSPKIYYLGILFSMALIFISSLSWYQAGWVWRFQDLSETVKVELQPKEGKLRQYAYRKILKLDKGGFKNNGKTKVLVIGDSQAGDFINMMYENKFDNFIDFSSIVIDSRCQPLLTPDIELVEYIGDKYRSKCKRQREKIMNSSKLDEADVIVLGASWRSWGIKYLPETIMILKKKTTEIFVVGLKMQSVSGQTFLIRNNIRGELYKVSAQKRHQVTKKRNKVLRDGSGKKTYSYVDVEILFCKNKEACLVVTPEGKVIFYDRNHLTPEGAKHLGNLLYVSCQLPFINRHNDNCI